MVLETYDTPPSLPAPKKPTNLFIIIKHAFETATKGCCWPFLKATAFYRALFKKPLIVVEWMSLWVKHLHLSPSDWSVTIITNNIDDCKKKCLFLYLAFLSRDEPLPLPPLLLELDDFFFIICNLLSTGNAELLLLLLLLLLLPLDTTREPELEPMGFDGFLLNPEILLGLTGIWK